MDNATASRKSRPALVVPPREACEMLRIGLTRCYELLNSGELESFKDGKARKITVRSIEAYVERQIGRNRQQNGRSTIQPSPVDHQKVAVP